MKLRITGCSTELQGELEHAFHFYIAELVPEHLRDGIKSVHIIVGPRKHMGGCLNAIKRDPTRFRMVIASNMKLEFPSRKHFMLTTLAHECVHLKQFFLGELYDITPAMTPDDKSIARWRYRRHYIKAWKYNDQPWEIEAAELEPKLYAKYLRSIGMSA